MTKSPIPAHFRNDEAARKLIESVRWPDGPICSHCGSVGHAYAIKKPGWYRCAEKECRKDFTVTTGTVMERSHIPLHKWLMAFYLMNSSKKGISAHQLHRTLGIRYQSAWFMCHRIREAMRTGGLGPLGGEGKIIESDETYWGPKDVDRDPAMRRRRRGKPGHGGKARIMTLVERGGQARSVHVADLTNETMQRILLANADRNSRLMTDEGTSPSIGLLFASHETVKHGAYEYARGDVATNTVKAISACSNAECAALTSTAKRSICIGIWPSSTIATITGSSLVLTIPTAPSLRSKAQAASASHTGNLIKPNFKFQAARFMRWRKRRKRRRHD
jgi:transposase-like protein